MHNLLTIDENSPVQQIDSLELKKRNISLCIKRDDLLHPLISGNKWRKLKYNLTAMQTQGKTELLTFGGAFSNHIHACAAAGKLFNIKTYGIIRGPELDLNNPKRHRPGFCPFCARRWWSAAGWSARKSHGPAPDGSGRCR